MTELVFVCEGCGKPIEKKRASGSPRKWCSERCRQRSYGDPCVDCGARTRRFEQADGHWPYMTTVVRVFGSWNRAIREAGFEPRAPHGGGGNALRRPASTRCWGSPES